MANIYNNITISFETRLCTVDGKLGYFHCWEHYSKPIEPSPMIGGHPGGILSQIFGVVEFPDGVKRVDPYQIKFCDEQNEILQRMNEQMKGET